MISTHQHPGMEMLNLNAADSSVHVAIRSDSLVGLCLVHSFTIG